MWWRRRGFARVDSVGGGGFAWVNSVGGGGFARVDSVGGGGFGGTALAAASGR